MWNCVQNCEESRRDLCEGLSGSVGSWMGNSGTAGHCVALCDPEGSVWNGVGRCVGSGAELKGFSGSCVGCEDRGTLRSLCLCVERCAGAASPCGELGETEDCVRRPVGSRVVQCLRNVRNFLGNCEEL